MRSHLRIHAQNNRCGCLQVSARRHAPVLYAVSCKRADRDDSPVDARARERRRAAPRVGCPRVAPREPGSRWSSSFSSRDVTAPATPRLAPRSVSDRQGRARRTGVVGPTRCRSGPRLSDLASLVESDPHKDRPEDGTKIPSQELPTAASLESEDGTRTHRPSFC